MPVMGQDIGYVLFFYKHKSAKRLKRLLVFIENIPLTFIINGVYSAIKREYRYRTQNGNRAY